jgi:hypothetical protein
VLAAPFVRVRFSLSPSSSPDADMTLLDGGEPFAKAFSVAAEARRCVAAFGSTDDEWDLLNVGD